jgi:hypothetical protein
MSISTVRLGSLKCLHLPKSGSKTLSALIVAKPSLSRLFA